MASSREHQPGHQNGQARKRRYVALAKNGSEGHAFTFDEAPTGPKLAYTDPGCNRKCEDNTLCVCGCADSGCVGLERQADEEHLRRWVVYDLYAETETEKKRKLAEEKSAEEEKKKFLKWASGSPAGGACVALGTSRRIRRRDAWSYATV